MKIINGEMHIEEIEQLLKDYLTELGRNLSFQNVAAEFYDLKSKYLPPNGKLLCAQTANGEIVGCVAYYKHNDQRCEMKRLYVKPDYRRNNAGRLLVDAIIELARRDGYSENIKIRGGKYNEQY